MNIYLLSQDENSGYDTYDSCVVIAESIEEAKKIHPNYDPDYPEINKNMWKYLYSEWAADSKHVTAVLIGKLDPDYDQKNKIILASFNAG